jgi:excisionase family DNA binding protein
VDDNNSRITVDQAARRLGKSIEQVRRYLREGKLPGRRIGGQWFIEESAINQYKQSPRTAPLREAATMEYIATSRDMTKIEALIARVAERREEVRKRIGDLKIDVVEMLREDRDSH